ncbi:MAG TPA: flavin reductase family protein [Actinophytocola sp.]|uniref:3-hydroxy-9,10-secoandrosta-1,3,5(10)-triene-9, 17-dione monooxygenase reductase subunit n=1 Tax=Actinophytocola sp. TaxID=1872138 RepID=UPI002DDCC7FB|nr:3-hydroxy-9,10-secoandrosta-1,3,5(10)-triene-9,17-dione monooxygenase reductase subunit [Actinophytocola sp.]HEV2781762.1 flavin reductase family protein [Actinophytocola sp.]
MITQAIDQTRFRVELGHFCTGVTVVTACDGDVPVGFACQSFAALSLDPPLVLFCPAKRSRTWPIIERAGCFAVNVLTYDQRWISTVFGRSGVDKFAAVAWTPAPSGAPVLDGVLTWIDCAVETVHDAGDHHVVVGRVTALGEHRDERPLLFYRGAYTATEPAEPTPGILDNLITWSRSDDWI